jgi:hypothetical protein
LRGALERKLPPKGPRPYRTRKEHERNAELLAFVAERIVGFLDLVRGQRGGEDRPDPFFPGHRRGPAVSIWKALYEEWNRAHPHDLYQDERSFARAYYRAIDPERPLLRELVLEVRQAYRAAEDITRELWLEGLSLARELTDKPHRGLVSPRFGVAILLLAATRDPDALPRFAAYARKEEAQACARAAELAEELVVRGLLSRPPDQPNPGGRIPNTLREQAFLVVARATAPEALFPPANTTARLRDVEPLTSALLQQEGMALLAEALESPEQLRSLTDAALARHRVALPSGTRAKLIAIRSLQSLSSGLLQEPVADGRLLSPLDEQLLAAPLQDRFGAEAAGP